MKKSYVFPADAPYRRYMALAAFLLMVVAAGGALFELVYFLSVNFVPRAIIGFIRYSLFSGFGFLLVRWEKKHRQDESPEWVLLPSYIFAGTALFGNLIGASFGVSWVNVAWLLFGVGAVIALYILTIKGVLKIKLPLFISSLAVPATLLTAILIDTIGALAWGNVVGLIITGYTAAHLVLMGLFLAVAVVSLKETQDEAAAAEPVAAEPATKRFCTACGATLTDDLVFCTQCGQRVGK